MMRPAVEFADVHRWSGAGATLEAIDLRVDAGERVAVLGPNGAGKSTLIRALLDLCRIDRGAMRLDGQPHTGQAARARLAYLPERFQPPQYLHGRGYLEHMLALYGVRPADAPITGVCYRLGLDAHALGWSVQAYSRGMIQLLGLAGCLLAGRPLLVLDEPLHGLEPASRASLRDALAAHPTGAVTVLFTTEVAADAEALADRIAILHGGRLVATGTPEAIAWRIGVANLERAVERLRGASTDALP